MTSNFFSISVSQILDILAFYLATLSFTLLTIIENLEELMFMGL